MDKNRTGKKRHWKLWVALLIFPYFIFFLLLALYRPAVEILGDSSVVHTIFAILLFTGILFFTIATPYAFYHLVIACGESFLESRTRTVERMEGERKG